MNSRPSIKNEDILCCSSVEIFIYREGVGGAMFILSGTCAAISKRAAAVMGNSRPSRFPSADVQWTCRMGKVLPFFCKLTVIWVLFITRTLASAS